MKVLLTSLILAIAVLNCGTPQPQEPEVIEKEIGAPPEGMVLIPSGYYTMGSDSNNESPKHKVWVEPFFIDKYEVTNHQYREFVDSTGHPAPSYFRDSDFNKPDQPVVGVSYYDALSYARWVGKRLPTEAEWERASRGGMEQKEFPWGNDLPFKKCNYAPKGNKEADGFEYTAPVGQFLPTNYGIYDMSGNVWEWCEDFYDTEYYKYSPEKNPVGPDSGYSKVLRGGSGMSINPKYLRCASRLELKPFVQDKYYGFRCVQTP